MPGGSGVILGRDAKENAILGKSRGIVVEPPEGMVGPTALVPVVKCDSDLDIARQIVRAWSRGTAEGDRDPFKGFQIL